MFSKAKQSIENQTEESKSKNEASLLNKTKGNLPDYNCPDCKNKGLIYKAIETDVFGTKHWEVVSSQCSCIKIRNEIARIKQSGISRLIKDKTFKNYRTTDDWQHNIKTKCCQYANNPGGWLYIGGQSGCGKTHLCTAIIGQLLKNGKEAKYMLWQDDITTLKQTVNDYEAHSNLMDSFKKVDVLYIDDFFKTRNKERVSSADVNTTFKIINYRYNEKLCTIISSELSIYEISEIDEALGSRIIELCGTNVMYIRPDKFKNYRYKLNGDTY